MTSENNKAQTPGIAKNPCLSQTEKR